MPYLAVGAVSADWHSLLEGAAIAALHHQPHLQQRAAEASTSCELQHGWRCHSEQESAVAAGNCDGAEHSRRSDRASAVKANTHRPSVTQSNAQLIHPAYPTFASSLVLQLLAAVLCPAAVDMCVDPSGRCALLGRLPAVAWMLALRPASLLLKLLGSLAAAAPAVLAGAGVLLALQLAAAMPASTSSSAHAVLLAASICLLSPLTAEVLLSLVVTSLWIQLLLLLLLADVVWRAGLPGADASGVAGPAAELLGVLAELPPVCKQTQVTHSQQ